MALSDADEEARLIRAAQSHDLAAFASLVQRHHAGVRAFLAVRSNSSHDAEDLAQEVFVTAFRKMDKCDPARPLGPWLRGIAVNLLANHRRKFRALPIGLNEELQDLVDAELAQRFETAGEGVALEALHECLERVDGASRRLLQARYNDCLSLEDLAAQLNRKVSAVSMQLHRLRVVLGDCIESKIRESSRSSETT